MAPQLPWTDDMVCTLLNIVIVKGAHLASGKKVTEKWTEVLNEFYLQDDIIPFKSVHFKAGDFRKIRDKFKSVCDNSQKAMDSGNKSSKTGELSEIFTMCQQIKNDEDELSEEKETKKELKRKLNVNEESILNKVKEPSVGWGTRKLMDGSIVGGDKMRSNKPLPVTFEQELLSFVKGSYNTEEKQEMLLLEWVEVNGKTCADLVSEASLNPALLVTLEEFSLPVLISIYCSPGEGFSAKVFKDALLAEDFPTIAAHKLYALLQKWRRDAAEAADQLKTPSSTSSASTVPQTFTRASPVTSNVADALAAYTSDSEAE